jgi:putative ATPase
MRPASLDEFAGQQHFLGPGKLLRRMLEADRLTSVIFYGPPGTGKTTLASLIANYTDSHFEQLNAASGGVKEVRAVIDAAKEGLAAGGKRTVLFLDEIHRFNRAQQDSFLPVMEDGTVTLIGATTENPFFAVNSPLVSRSQIFQFAPLSEEDVETLIRRAIADKERGFGTLDLQITDEAVKHWATISDGDARRALMALEIAVLSQSGVRGSGVGVQGKDNPSSPNPDPRTPNPIFIDLDTAEQSIQQKAIVYDATGDEHYDAASAFIKSMRGSDPDAAIYWLARMLEAGEDPRFIARRIAILASEDIGNADPRAIAVAAAAFEIVEKIGLPEGRITLAQAVIYMATAPKSNASYTAINDAIRDVKEGRTLPVPKHLRDASYRGAQRFGHGKGYQYAHHSEKGYVEQDYLGVDKTYYTPTNRGYEIQIAKYLAWLREPPADSPNSPGVSADPQEGKPSG